jgi:CRP/FNR family transcriptional regulator, cyclic AMP receptor protein
MDILLAKRVGFLAALSPDDLGALLSCAERITFRKQQDILQQGQHCATLFIVQEGLLHVRRQAKQHEVLLGRLEPGSVFGEVSLFDPGPTSASVRAISDGVLIGLRRPHLDTFAANRPAAAVQVFTGILTEVAKRLRQVDEQLIDSILWGGLLR